MAYVRLIEPEQVVMAEVEWWFRLPPSQLSELWDWADGPPPVRDLAPVRGVRSSARNRHVPVTAFSTTTSTHVALESGLEHDLLRRLDRLPMVVWLVSQPMELRWVAPSKLRHIPDLLSVRADGAVTVWDVRRSDRIDERFSCQSERTREACSGVGWEYQVFTGLGEVERLNLLWLHGYRRTPAWQRDVEPSIFAAASGEDRTLGSLFALDSGSGEVKAAVWHLVWTGQLVVDLTVKLSAVTPIQLVGEGDGR